jgi:prevent-host-death family protein
MIRYSVADAGQNIDAVIEAAQHDPVEIVRDGAGVAVVLSMAALRTLLSRGAAAPHRDIAALMDASKTRYDGVYRALAAWEAKNEPRELDSER